MDLSSGSKDDDESKRQTEENPDASCLNSPTGPVNVLINCLKNMEKEQRN